MIKYQYLLRKSAFAHFVLCCCLPSRRSAVTHNFKEILARFLVHYSAKCTPVPTHFPHLVVMVAFSSNSPWAFCRVIIFSACFSGSVFFLFECSTNQENETSFSKSIVCTYLSSDYRRVLYGCRDGLFSPG